LYSWRRQTVPEEKLKRFKNYENEEKIEEKIRTGYS